ncbi:SDR family oxidoreductase [Lysobacter sp. K5869]|uniref:SDR family NAD(P)-dependent oxidoreductase n=1 Tax=Lysobacter sp. K5869 TaxID=2820808 RepID=UPI001C060FD5|nr:SDR family oxidoreductase [Lysobacter sp. K5869]QWP75199.1 SDR family oxidoreductase [Lysobacter sp. K5869]
MSTLPTVVVTGASTGIGAVYADRFARRGHDLILVARDLARLDALAQRLRAEYGVNAQPLQADLADPAQLARVETLLRDDTRIGVLINNAGATLPGGFLDQSPEQAAQLIALNVTAPTRLAAAIAPRLAAAGSGAIVNLASVVGLAPEFGSSVYGATKAFVQYLSQSLQLELGGQGVYVQAVLPAATRTEIWARSGRDVEQIPGVMEVDALVDAALAGYDRRETVTIPPLHDEGLWQAADAARKAMLPHYSQSQPAPRYLNGG